MGSRAIAHYEKRHLHRAYMTAILATCGRSSPEIRSRTVERMLGAMASRGSDEVEEWHGDTVALGTSFNSWEREIGGGGKGMSIVDDRCLVVCDASLYYLDEFPARVGVSLPSTARTAAAAIAAAYLHGGASWLEQIEGDFAFVLWDKSLQRLVAARDISGRRSLYFASSSRGLVIASTIGGVRAHPWVGDELDLVSLTETAAYLWAHSRATCYKDIKELRGGEALTWTPEGEVGVERFWRPPPGPSRATADTEEAAEQLGELLADAVDRRMAPGGITAVSLSGGWDSTSVYGAGKRVLREAHSGDRRQLRPVSISYPEGHRAREDEIIGEVAAMWGDAPNWVAAADLSLISGRIADPARRPQAWFHPFESLNRGVAKRVRGIGGRVSLDGGGGDELFQTSLGFLADLTRRGRLREAAAQWRSGGGGLLGFVRWALLPLLPRTVLAGLVRLGAPARIEAPWAREPAPWFRREFLDAHGILENERSTRPTLTRRSHVAAETEMFKLFPFFDRVYAETYSVALEEGVEARSPLQDSRIVEFAFHRPWFERRDLRRGESKVMLRRAMRGLLPDEVLAPRNVKTGLTGQYLFEGLLAEGEGFMRRTRKESPLSDAGIVDIESLEQSWESLRGHGGSSRLAAELFFTLQTDEWLRARSIASPGAADS